MEIIPDLYGENFNCNSVDCAICKFVFIGYNEVSVQRILCRNFFLLYRKLLSCKERADGIVEDVVEIKNAKGQPLFHAVVRYQAGLASYTCETVNATKAVWEKGEPAIVYYQNSKPENAFVKNAAWTGRLILGIMQSLVAVAIGIAYYVGTH